jgi:hypothetical protein
VKLFLISMIRNEVDILASFLAHVDALFDCGFLVDHLSCDGSEVLLREFVAARPGWQLRRLETPRYLQAELSCELLAKGFEGGADAVLFLDADEFVHRLDRAALERAVAGLGERRQLGHLRWRNCIPGEYREPFELAQPAWLCAPSEHKKIVLPRWLHERHPGRVLVNQGNHTALLPESCDEVSVGELLHFPIRSQRQLAHKTLTTWLSQASREDGVIAPHIRALFDTLSTGDLSAERMNAIAIEYGAPFVIDARLDAAELRARGHRLGRPEVVTRDEVGAQLRRRVSELQAAPGWLARLLQRRAAS